MLSASGFNLNLLVPPFTPSGCSCNTVKFINTYETPSFIYPDSNDLSRIQIFTHVWTMGDKYYKLADAFYGDSRDWWVIAKFNQKPTESHVKIGDIILIPKPLSVILNYLRG